MTRFLLLLFLFHYYFLSFDLFVGVVANNNNIETTCRLYLATSTIPNSGLGMFLGDYNNNDDIPYNAILTTNDILIPIIDINWNNEYDTKLLFLWNNYVWSSQDFAYITDLYYHDEIDIASFGIGSIPNCLYPLINIRDTNISIDYGYSTTHNNNYNFNNIHPSIGSYSIYHNRRAMSSSVNSGDELFVSYGEGYFLDKQYNYVPFQSTYNITDTLLKHHMLYSKPSISMLNNYTSTNYYNKNELYDIVRNIIQTWDERLYNTLLPDYYDMMINLYDYNTTKYMHKKRSQRSIKKLEEDGICIDYVYVSDSTIPNIGRGLFSSKSFETNEIITTIPLIHIPNRTIFTIYNGYYKKLSNTIYKKYYHNRRKRQLYHNTPYNEYKVNHSNPIHYQLLLNYCYGHNDSTILLCPYGVGTSLINHHTDSNYINAKIVWSTKMNIHDEWLQQSISQWSNSTSTGLAFDLIALRPIKHNEEIFINYGIEWENAWNTHVQNFIPHIHLSQQLNYNNQQSYNNDNNEHEIQDQPQYYHDYNDDYKYHVQLNQQRQYEQQQSYRRRYIDIPLHHEIWPWSDVHLWCRIDNNQQQNLFKSFQKKPNNNMDKLMSIMMSNVYNDPYNGKTYRPCTILSKTKINDHDDIDSYYYTVQFHTLYHDLPPYPFGSDDNDNNDDELSHWENDYNRIYGIDSIVDTCMSIFNYIRYELMNDYNNYINNPYQHLDSIIGFHIQYNDMLFGNSYTPYVEYHYYHEPWTFRHDIRIPNDIMPNIWKNLN